MKLTVGRIVIYHVADGEPLDNGYSRNLPAIVVHPWGDSCANLKIFTNAPLDVLKTSVREGEEPGCWSWPAAPADPR